MLFAFCLKYTAHLTKYSFTKPLSLNLIKLLENIQFTRNMDNGRSQMTPEGYKSRLWELLTGQ